MERKATAWFGAILVILGILGFIPGVTTSGYHLFNLFQVGAWYNALYIVIGAIGLASLATDAASAAYLKAASVVFVVWAIVGLVVGTSGQVLGFMSNNYWDAALNAVLAVVAAGFGWASLGAYESRGDAVAFGEYEHSGKSDWEDRR